MTAQLYPWFRRKPGRIYFVISSEDKLNVLSAYIKLGSAQPPASGK